jgi:hypothetical protein
MLDTFQLEVTWGDGVVEFVDLGAGATVFEVTHRYADDDPAGTASDPYAIAVTVRDDDGGAASTVESVVVDNVAPTIEGLATSSVSRRRERARGADRSHRRSGRRGSHHRRRRLGRRQRRRRDGRPDHAHLSLRRTATSTTIRPRHRPMRTRSRRRSADDDLGSAARRTSSRSRTSPRSSRRSQVTKCATPRPPSRRSPAASRTSARSTRTSSRSRGATALRGRFGRPGDAHVRRDAHVRDRRDPRLPDRWSPASTTTAARTATTVDTIGYLANRPPVARDDGGTGEEGVSIDVDLLGNDSDPDGDALTSFVLSRPTTGRCNRSAAATSATRRAPGSSAPTRSRIARRTASRVRMSRP